MRLLKQDTPFVWDETAQLAFEELKKTLLLDPLLFPCNFPSLVYRPEHYSILQIYIKFSDLQNLPFGALTE